MSATIYYELQLLAASLAVGLCLMAVYDGLRIFRVLIPHKSLWTGIEDAIYWVVSSITTFLLLFRQNDGILRWYAIGGVLLGMLIYNMTVSRILLRLLKKSEKYFTIRRTRRRARKRQKRTEKRLKREKRRLEQDEARKAKERKRRKEDEERKAREQERRKEDEERKAREQERRKQDEERKAREQERRKQDKQRKSEEAADAGKRESAKKEKRKSE